MSAIVISGFRKCGTSTVYTWLNDGKNAFGSENYKEPQYFCNMHPERDAATRFYRSLYERAPPGVPWLDGSTLMMSDPDSFSRADAFFGGRIKIIVLIRDPARRMVSAYFHMRGKGGGEEKRDLDALVEHFPRGLDAAGILRREQEGLEAALRDGTIAADYLGPGYLRSQMGIAVPFRSADPLWTYRYFGESLYATHLDAVKAVVPAASLGVFVMEEVFGSQACRRELAGFLGLDVDELGDFASTGVVNKGYMKGRFGSLERMKALSVLKWVIDRIPKSVKGAVKDRIYAPLPTATDRQIAAARAVLACEYEHWRGAGVDVDRLWA